MRRGLKPLPGGTGANTRCAARAAPYEKGTETDATGKACAPVRPAARAAPYEKGTETAATGKACAPVRPAARAAPYEKGTETDKYVINTGYGVSRARGPL